MDKRNASVPQCHRFRCRPLPPTSLIQRVTNLPKLRPELLFSLHAFEQDLLQSNSQVNLSRALSAAEIQALYQYTGP